MSRLIETIRISDGRLQNAYYHLKRIEQSSTALFGGRCAWQPEQFLGNLMQTPLKGVNKCRLVYDQNEVRFTIQPYTIRPVTSLKLVTDNDIAYDHKFEERSVFEKLLASKGDCDDILIIKNGKVTDVSYANIIFRKDNEWVTPSTFLLNGTMRQFLVDTKKISERVIRAEDISSYTHFKLVNAMIALEGSESEVSNIR